MQRRNTIMPARFLAIWAVYPALCLGQSPDRDDSPAANPAQAQGRAAVARPEQEAAGPRQAGAPAIPVNPANAKKLERLLKKWEAQSSLLKTLDVRILRIDQNPAWGVVEYYEGRALFKSPNLAFIDWSTIKQDDKKKPQRDPRNQKNWLSMPFERIVCTGDEVWQYKSDTQQIFIYPLAKNEKKKAIEEGPLPFLFNMHAADAKQRYEMRLISEDAKGYGVSIKPKLPEDTESFSIAYVHLDQDFLPSRILMRSPDGKSQKDFRLGPTYPNKSVNAKNFEGKPLGPPWKIVRNPGGDERPRAGGNRAHDREEAPAAARPRADAIER